MGIPLPGHLSIWSSAFLFNWPTSDEQELTNSLKSPREDEQRYAAYVRSGKGVGGQRPGVVTEMEREKSS